MRMDGREALTQHKTMSSPLQMLTINAGFLSLLLQQVLKSTCHL